MRKLSKARSERRLTAGARADGRADAVRPTSAAVSPDMLLARRVQLQQQLWDAKVATAKAAEREMAAAMEAAAAAAAVAAAAAEAEAAAAAAGVAGGAPAAVQWWQCGTEGCASATTAHRYLLSSPKVRPPTACCSRPPWPAPATACPNQPLCGRPAGALPRV